MTQAHDKKKKILGLVVESLEKDLQVLTHAAQVAREAATHEESKAEDKYDTRGLEASYLAGAQAKRAAEIQELIRYYHFMDLPDFSKDSTVAATALVELEASGKKLLCFVVPKGGGLTVQLGSVPVQVITPVSRLGEELIGRSVEDEFELAVAGSVREYRILGIC